MLTSEILASLCSFLFLPGEEEMEWYEDLRGSCSHPIKVTIKGHRDGSRNDSDPW